MDFKPRDGFALLQNTITTTRTTITPGAFFYDRSFQIAHVVRRISCLAKNRPLMSFRTTLVTCYNSDDQLLSPGHAHFIGGTKAPFRITYLMQANSLLL